jgi:hypothetical protein
MNKCPTCGSYAVNDDPERGLCDKCWRDATIDDLRAKLAAADALLIGERSESQLLRNSLSDALERLASAESRVAELQETNANNVGCYQMQLAAAEALLGESRAALARIALNATDSQPSEFAQECMGYPGTSALWDIIKAVRAKEVGGG